MIPINQLSYDEDNIVVIDQAKHDYIKGDNTKFISLELFFTHEQQAFQKIEVQYIRSSKNHAYLFTKSLLKSSFQKHIKYEFDFVDILANLVNYGCFFEEDDEDNDKMTILRNLTIKICCKIKSENVESEMGSSEGVEI
ncbi:hypothetical protein LXL04_007126 [Taraxacum kok-saghyz]